MRPSSRTPMRRLLLVAGVLVTPPLSARQPARWLATWAPSVYAARPPPPPDSAGRASAPAARGPAAPPPPPPRPRPPRPPRRPPAPRRPRGAPWVSAARPRPPADSVDRVPTYAD